MVVHRAESFHHALEYADADRDDPLMPFGACTPGIDPLLKAQLTSLGQQLDGLVAGDGQIDAQSNAKVFGPKQTWRAADFEDLPQQRGVWAQADRLNSSRRAPATRQALEGGGPLPPKTKQPNLDGNMQLPSLDRKCVDVDTDMMPTRRLNAGASDLQNPTQGHAELLERVFQGLEFQTLSLEEALESLSKTAFHSSRPLGTCAPPVVSTNAAAAGAAAAAVTDGRFAQCADILDATAPSKPRTESSCIATATGASTPPTPTPAAPSIRLPPTVVHERETVEQSPQIHVLLEQVNALSQSLAGLGARIVNWSVDEMLAAKQRLELHDIVLEYVLPCAHTHDALARLATALTQDAVGDMVKESAEGVANVTYTTAAPAVADASGETQRLPAPSWRQGSNREVHGYHVVMDGPDAGDGLLATAPASLLTPPPPPRPPPGDRCIGDSAPAAVEVAMLPPWKPDPLPPPSPPPAAPPVSPRSERHWLRFQPSCPQEHSDQQESLRACCRREHRSPA